MTAQPATPDNASPETPAGRLWEWLTFAALVVLVFHLMGLWYRWGRPDPQFLGFTSSVAGLLAWFSLLGLQTEKGRRLAVRLDEVFSFHRILRTARSRCLATWGVAAVVALLFYGGSPLAASLYNRHGTAALEAGQYSVALRDFRQAASLAPGDPATHYNMAFVYATTNDYDQAAAEFLQTLELDDTFWPAYNNLGHLYLLQDKAEEALQVLLVGQRQVMDPVGQAVMEKNVAWAYLELGLPRAALESLARAQAGLETLQSQGQAVAVYLAEVHRLQALALGDQGQSEESLRAWQDCLGYALSVVESPACGPAAARLPIDCLDAIHWAAEAREALAAEPGAP
jgi:hypothetical protein